MAQIAAAKETAKADKKTQQAEFERQREEHKAALPDAIKERAQAKADAIARSKSDLGDDQSAQDRIAELEEAVRVLEAENAELRAEVAKFGPMRVQFEQGGFEKVIADKDELLRVADARIVSESADKASWMKSAKYWQDEAKKRGWSDTVTIDIETGEVVNG
ncbi:MAG: hypothetical protein EOR50_05905 [Mesorhizobium sp.]|nr:MAG: hypothetical protein EOR50_05905 [Mesorhizobium sp.]RWL08747.1 MAG: hypothetical protein EOR55_03375 [Mesorhizobium sp.]